VSTQMPLDGSSFAALLKGQEWTGPDYRFWQWNRGVPRYSHNAAVREGDWKLVRPFVTKNMPNGNSKLASRLFNLAEDPAESEDLREDHPDRAASMERELQRWTEDVESERIKEGRE
ncbi:MAG: arylsulfatase, partial [Verrucomicrobiota bacterium]